MSSVLRILDRQTVSPPDTAPMAAESFAAVLSSSGPAQEKRFDSAEIRQELASMSREHPLPPKDRAAVFSVEQRTYDTFLRALNESKKPLSAHALDLFQ
jgi:hypothetical protein